MDKERITKVIATLERFKTELEELVAEDRCTHEMGVCWCSLFKAMDEAAEAAETLRLA